jgi:hypothetical protein
MDNNKEAMKLTIVARIMEELLFGEDHEEVTITKDYFRGEFMKKFSRRAAKLISAANMLYKKGADAMECVAIVFIADEIAEEIVNKDCDICDHKEECEDTMDNICKN